MFEHLLENYIFEHLQPFWLKVYEEPSLLEVSVPVPLTCEKVLVCAATFAITTWELPLGHFLRTAYHQVNPSLSLYAGIGGKSIILRGASPVPWVQSRGVAATRVPTLLESGVQHPRGLKKLHTLLLFFLFLFLHPLRGLYPVAILAQGS